MAYQFADLFLAPGREKPIDTLYDAVQHYVEDYWTHFHETAAWQYLGLYTPPMAECITIRLYRNGDPPEFVREETVDVEDYIEEHVSGQLIAISRRGELRTATVHCEHSIPPVTEARYDWTLDDYVRSHFGTYVMLTIVDMGDGPRIVDIAPELTGAPNA